MNRPRPNWPGDYQDLSFVQQRGDGRAGEAFEKLVEDKKIKINYVKSNLHALKFVLLQRADCTIISRMCDDGPFIQLS